MRILPVSGSWFFCMLSLVAVIAPAARGTGEDAQEQRPYCGVYSLYAAAVAQGADLPFTDLLKPDYIGCNRGSSLGELKRAATDHGLFAEAVDNLSVSDLASLSCPAILHVRSEPASKEYDHYVCVLGMDAASRARVMDPSRDGVTTVDLQEVAPLWSGRALLVSNRSIATRGLTWARVSWFAACAAVVLCGLVAVARLEAVGRRARAGVASRPALRGALVQGALIVPLATAGATLYHRVEPAGLMGSRGLSARVDAAFAPRTFREVPLAEVRAEVSTGRALLVDARMPADYQAGHPDGAVNIPPTADAKSRRSALARESGLRPIIVFCQSAGCPYSKEVARKLAADGYADVRIYRGGWAEWSAAAAPQKQQPGRQAKATESSNRPERA